MPCEWLLEAFEPLRWECVVQSVAVGVVVGVVGGGDVGEVFPYGGVGKEEASTEDLSVAVIAVVVVYGHHNCRVPKLASGCKLAG